MAGRPFDPSREFEPFTPFRPFSPTGPSHNAWLTTWGTISPKTWTKPGRDEVPYDPPIKFLPTGIGQAGYIGKVVSGSGGQYQVTIYDNGPLLASSFGGDVTVNILMYYTTDQLMPGTWLTGIMVFSDPNGKDVYYAQPPVWMA